MNFKLLPIVFFTFFAVNFAFAQPSDAEIKQRVRDIYSKSDIVSIKLGDARLETKWVRDRYITYWDKSYVLTLKTEYPGVTVIHFGGAEYVKSGSTYTFKNMLTSGFDRYEGIPIPSKDELNKILQEKFDPVNFYSGYLLGYIVDAGKNIEVAEGTDFKWVGLNRLRFNVKTTYELKTSNIGNMAVREGIFQVYLERSADGKTFDKDAKLLLDGEWLPVANGSLYEEKDIKEYKISQKEQDAMNTLKELGAVRMAEEFKKSLVPLDMPDFKSSHHLMQYIHEMLIEGDEDKVKSLLYNMLPRFYFEEWSDVVLNGRGEDLFEQVLENLEYYKLAFCKHPQIKEISGTQVSFYDRSKYRMNKISVSWENDRWYIYDLGYFIMDGDLEKYAAAGESNCGGDLIYIEGEPAFKAGDPIEVYRGGNWIAGKVVRPEMEKGRYHVIYGASGLEEWFFANNVRGRELNKEDVVNKLNPGTQGKKLKSKLKKKKIKVGGFKL